jgi:5'-nucleotidase
MNRLLLSGIILLLLVSALGLASGCFVEIAHLFHPQTMTAPSSKGSSSVGVLHPTSIPPAQPTPPPRHGLSSSPSVQPLHPTAKPMRIYTVKQGDRLWSIAQTFYGNGHLWRHIAAANNIDHPNHIYAGDRLLIPDIAP